MAVFQYDCLQGLGGVSEVKHITFLPAKVFYAMLRRQAFGLIVSSNRSAPDYKRSQAHCGKFGSQSFN